MADGTLRLVYAGALTPVYELDVAIEAVASLVGRRPDLPISFEVYGRGDSENELRALVQARDLGDHVTFHGRIPFEAVPAAIAAADIGLAPTRLDSYTVFSLSTKIFEYAAMRRPVVATRLPLVERTFGEGTVATYPAGDATGFAEAIESLVDRPEERAARVEATYARVAALAWERTAADYLAVVEGLAADGLSSAAAGIADPAASVRPDLEDA
jgi:glycosyltransferase involved in cell wall biosynthesis